MTNEEAIKVLLDEWKCIDRNDGINCDRKCESCDLVMDTFVLKDAYNTAIKALEQEPKTGHWILGVCDECGYDWGKDAPIASVPNFCPYCGCSMVES